MTYPEIYACLSRYDWQHLGRMPLSFGVKMVIETRKAEREEADKQLEERVWQCYLADRPYLDNGKIRNYDEYKAKMIKSKNEKPDKEKFYRLYGDKIKRGG